ncbi:hypothetical protein Tco_0581229 [Tanacetum coccineum]
MVNEPDTLKAEIENNREDGELPSLNHAMTTAKDITITPFKESGIKHSRRLALITKSVASPRNKGKSVKLPSFRKHDEDLDLFLVSDSEVDEPTENDEATRSEEIKITVSMEYSLRPPFVTLNIFKAVTTETELGVEADEWFNELRAMKTEKSSYTEYQSLMTYVKEVARRGDTDELIKVCHMQLFEAHLTRSIMTIVELETLLQVAFSVHEAFRFVFRMKSGGKSVNCNLWRTVCDVLPLSSLGSEKTRCKEGFKATNSKYSKSLALRNTKQVSRGWGSLQSLVFVSVFDFLDIPAMSTSDSNQPMVLQGDAHPINISTSSQQLTATEEETPEPQSTPPHQSKQENTKKELNRVANINPQFERDYFKAIHRLTLLNLQRKQNTTSEQPMCCLTTCVFHGTS